MKKILALNVAIVVAAAFFSVSVANASLINVSSQALNANQSGLPDFTCSIQNSAANSETCSNGPVTRGGASTTVATGLGSANVVTGELKALAKIETASEAQVASGRSEIKETINYTGVGAGTITAYLRVAGDWSLSQIGSSALGYQAQSTIQLGTVAIDNWFINGSTGPTSGSVDQLLSVSANVFGSGSILLISNLLAQITAAEGLMDFSNTARLHVEFSGGISGITFNNPDFLTAPTFAFPQSQIPEPSTLAIFGLGLAGLGFMMRRRRVA